MAIRGVRSVCVASAIRAGDNVVASVAGKHLSVDGVMARDHEKATQKQNQQIH